MKNVLQTLINEPCRTRNISDDELKTFKNYQFLQRYNPALDLFKIPESALSHKNLELPSKYIINKKCMVIIIENVSLEQKI